MGEVREALEKLGLGEYADAFIEEGFDTWTIVTDITESDLTDLGVKLGHRRKLQRAIAESRHQSVESSPRPGDRFHAGDPGSHDGAGSSRDLQPQGRTKRKYKRHPKPDPNAPERPASAYVLFSNDMRDMLKDRELTFTEMAKVVGERWQVLATDERDGYESHAAKAKEKYMNAMAEYKKTDEYAQYQDYLADFKARHSHQQPEHAADGPKRAKLETETSTETQSSLEDHMAAQRRQSASQNHHPPPSYGAYRHEQYSKSTSPSATHYSPLPSPARHAATDGYASQISPTSSSSRHGPYDLPSYLPTIGPTDRRLASLHDIDPGGRRNTPLLPQASSGSMSTLPPLTKEFSTLSSRSSGSPHSPPGASFHHPLMLKDSLPPVSRILPAPVGSMPLPGKTLEHRPLAPPLSTTSSPSTITVGGAAAAVPGAASYTPPDDARHSSSLAALLRAGELISEADRRQQEGPNANRPTSGPSSGGS